MADDEIRRRLIMMPPSAAALGDRRADCKVVLRNEIEEERRAEFDSWVVAHRGRLCPDEPSGRVLYEIPLVELMAGAP
ncbi:MAG: hypothetical protein JO153_08570 [Solirubrobacterales bacterium]|nr:hypothetical protein [Solirubrobacterales bacterium]